jgi:2',3'-cyclic-nucleotide 2'-phosphodiesterase
MGDAGIRNVPLPLENEAPVRILFIGDVVGKPGQRIVQRKLPEIRRRERINLVIANGENAADGSGITPAIFRKLRDAGVDCVTLGDHIYRRSEIYPVLESDPAVVKPANYPRSAPGKPWTIVSGDNGIPVAVFCLMGRVYMKPVDCPFSAADRVLQDLPADVLVRFVDFHAEATSDKQVMGRFLDGKVTAVLGTHTHVPTADEEIFPGGTAFQCDVGMTGPHHSIIGRKIERVLETTITFRPTQFQVATHDVRLNGTIVDVNPATGKAVRIARLQVMDDDPQPDNGLDD